MVIKKKAKAKTKKITKKKKAPAKKAPAKKTKKKAPTEKSVKIKYAQRKIPLIHGGGESMTLGENVLKDKLTLEATMTSANEDELDDRIANLSKETSSDDFVREMNEYENISEHLPDYGVKPKKKRKKR